SEIADDGLRYCKANNRGYETNAQRIGLLNAAFGDLPAEPPPIEDFRRWFAAQDAWKPATFNRYAFMLSLIYRIAIEHGKVSCANPAKKIKKKREENGRVRFLNQYSPDEEQLLRKLIQQDCPGHLPEFEIAMHTGMRRSEQYQLKWEDVDLIRRQITVKHS